MGEIGRIIPIDENFKFSKLGVYEGDYLIGEKIKFFVGKELLNLLVLRNEINEKKINGIKRLDVVEVEGTREENNFYASNIDLLQKNRVRIKDLLKGNISKGDYRNTIFQLLNGNERYKFELFNDIIHNIDEYFYKDGYFRVYLNQLQNYFQGGGIEGAYKTGGKYLKLTSEFDLRSLLNAGYGKVYHIGKSFRNIDQTNTSLNEFNVLEVIHQGKNAREHIEGHINFLLNIINKIPDKYRYLLNEKNILTLKEGKINFIEYEDFEKNGIPKEGIWCVNKYPITRSPLGKHGDGDYSEEYLLFCNGFCIGNILQIEDDIDALIRGLDKQGKNMTDKNNKGKNMIENIQSFGTPPAVGIGMGIESFVRFIRGENDIRNINIFNQF